MNHATHCRSPACFPVVTGNTSLWWQLLTDGEHRWTGDEIDGRLKRGESRWYEKSKTQLINTGEIPTNEDKWISGDKVRWEFRVGSWIYDCLDQGGKKEAEGGRLCDKTCEGCTWVFRYLTHTVNLWLSTVAGVAYDYKRFKQLFKGFKDI